jgi:hypothetical protein
MSHHSKKKNKRAKIEKSLPRGGMTIRIGTVVLRVDRVPVAASRRVVGSAILRWLRVAEGLRQRGGSNVYINILSFRQVDSNKQRFHVATV